MRVMRLAATSVLLVALVGACGGDDGDDPPERTSSASTTTTLADESSTTTAAGGGTATTAPGATTTAPTSGGGATTTVKAAANTTSTSVDFPKTRYNSTLTLGKKCVNLGDRQTLSVKTLPDIVVTYVTAYSDGDSHGSNGGGVSNHDGKYTASFVIAPGTPPGTATVTLTTSSRDQGPSFDQETFKVIC